MSHKTLILAGCGALLVVTVVILGAVSANESVVAASAVAATRSAQRLPTLPGVALPTVNPACVAGQGVPTPAAAPVNAACVAARVSPPASGAATTTGVRQGVAAIRPSVAQADALTPAITTADIERYVLAMPEGGVGKGVERQGSVRVVGVRCGPARDVEAQFQIETKVPAQTLVCVADVQGTFVASGLRGKRPVTNRTMYAVFDGKTGDLVAQVFKP